MNDIYTAIIISNCNYKANLRGIISVISKRGIYKYYNLK